MTELRVADVFVPGGFPRHTYNPRLSLQLEQKVEQARDNLCKLVTVTGHTKSGKTVLVRRVLPQEEALWVDGGAIGGEDDFWQVVTDQLDLFQTKEAQKTEGKEAELSASGSAGANLIVAKGKAELGGRLGTSSASSVTRSRTVSSKVTALAWIIHKK